MSEKKDNPLLLHSQYYIVIGGGPVGCYLAYKLLNRPNAHVVMFEGRKFERPQVLRIPFCIAQDIPESVKHIMWRDEETRAQIFSAGCADDPNFWPKPGYLYWPWISIGLFQESMIHFLQHHIDYKNRFFFIPFHGDATKLDLQKEINLAYPNDAPSIIKNITAIFCTCGTYAQSLRQKLNLLDGKLPEIKGHGIYLIYQNEKAENYLRHAMPMSYSQLGENGISYAASNNQNYDVQLYTYPAGKLTSVFNQLPDDFIQRAKYRSILNALDFTGAGMTSDSKRWFENYKSIIEHETVKADIVLPGDLSKIKIFYAPRTEYYWNAVTANIPWQQNQNAIPLFFLGDSAGSTDYKFGLSVGRGFLAVDALVNIMDQHHHDDKKIASRYQSYWDMIIAREFNKGPLLPSEPWIQYQYLIKGRKVKFENNKTIDYVSDEQYEHYLDEYQHLSPDFTKASEANSILFINTKALKDNIKNIIAFAKKADSNIIGVVKSNGYGLGATLVSELAIESGIDFLAVAKLQEAVALRHADIHNIDKVRIMTFEAPMVHDLSTYAVNQIEMILPSSKQADSVRILERWMQNKHRVMKHPLKVHVMVDTGMRRDGGFSSNSPQAVMETILALQRFDKTQIEFAGLATHLACYRCTDYKGKDVVNFRSLQFERLQEVINFLLTHEIQLPLIHIGGGLSLLAEQWPSQFINFTKTHDIKLYTRVGHGMYGMEFEKDLHADSPMLRSTVRLDLQVRHVFYVEEGEPVSYGGYWRAPKNGTWIATLAGGWADGVPRTAQTLGEWDSGMMVSINGQQYPVVGKINMNAMMVNLGLNSNVKPGDRAIIFGWRPHEPKLNDLAELSGQISPSIMVNVPSSMPRVAISE